MMQVTGDHTADRETPERRAIGQIGHCLRQGCVICIEHAPRVAPRYTPWQVWARPCCYNGDPDSICQEVERCRNAHADHHIRLNIEDISFRSRMSFVVHDPSTVT